METKMSSLVIHITMGLFRIAVEKSGFAPFRIAAIVWNAPWLAKLPNAQSVPFGLFVVFADVSRLVLYSSRLLPRVRVTFPARIISTGVAVDLVQLVFGPVQRVVAWAGVMVSPTRARKKAQK